MKIGFTESRHSDCTGPDTVVIKPQCMKEMRGRRRELSVPVCKIYWFTKFSWLEGTVLLGQKDSTFKRAAGNRPKESTLSSFRLKSCAYNGSVLLCAVWLNTDTLLLLGSKISLNCIYLWLWNLIQCFSTFVRPRAGKFLSIFLSSYIKLT